MEIRLSSFIILLSFLFVQSATAQKSSKIDSVLKQRYKTYRAAEDIAEKEQLLKDLQKEYPEENTPEARTIYDKIYNNLAISWLQKGDRDKYRAYSEKMDDKNRLNQSLIRILGGWNKKKERLSEAEEIGVNVVQYWNIQEKNDTDNYSGYMYTSALDTYAHTLQARGKEDQALKYYKLEADKLEENNRLQPDFIKRYADAFADNGNDAEAIEALASAVMHDKYDEEITTKLERLYVKTRGGSAGFASYLNALKEVGYQQTYNNVSDEQMSKQKPAPAFTLKNLEGQAVSLDDMKGKVVIVDFGLPGVGPVKHRSRVCSWP